MARKEYVQKGGLLLTDNWKLHPVDERNWELCKLTDKGWKPCGRYYSYNTVDQAILYVADELIKDGCRDEALTLSQYAAQYRDVADRVVAHFMRESLG